ncbi:hypothetical protein M9Y10_004849 [Tritrichomonas musculus]|uniref:Viral A-type inclusion protein n=1 Tax=Tritrichomonas musculus TaxID=1915356 RepID=A0ABR2JJP0_9EUKA
MEEIEGNTISSQMSDELDISLNFDQSYDYNDIEMIVVELSQIIRSISKIPTSEQIESINSKVDSLSENLNEISKNLISTKEQNTTIFEAYKVLSSALLILRQNQNEDNLYRRKYEEIKKEYELQEKLHQMEVENYKKGDNSSSNHSYADQIEDAKNELKSIRVQFERFKKKVDKSVSSIQTMMHLPENTTIKTLKDEISNKLKKMKSLNYSANDIQQSNFEKDKQLNESLLRELKNATDQCITAQTNEHLKDEEIKRLTDSLALFESQIASLTKEKNDSQNVLNALTKENSELKKQSECSDFHDKLFLTQTELGSLNIKYSDLIDKVDRLKKKLDKVRNENSSLKDEQLQNKGTIEKLQLELQQMKLENEELQAEYKSKSANLKPFEEIEAKNAQIENMNVAIEKIATQLSMQSQEIGQINNIKEKLIEYIQKQNEIISAFSKESSDLQSQLKKKEVEINDHTQTMKSYENEIESYKCFINGFSKLVSINMAQDAAAPIIKSLQQLRLEGLESLFTNLSEVTQQTKTSSPSSNDNKNRNLNEINQRLFQYVEDQINIIQAIASNGILGQNTTTNILKSCQEADEFVKEIAPSFYNEPTIFSSFGLVVNPSTLSNTLRTFLSTFKNVSSPESRELFDIAKQAIAMNSLLRSIASIIRNENERVCDEMQKTVDNISELRRSDYSDAESRISETEKLLSRAVEQKENSARKLEELKSTLKKMMEKGFIIPQKISEDLDNDGSFYIDSSEIEPPNQESDFDQYQKSEEFESIEILKSKLAKSQKIVKYLKQKVESLYRKNEKLKKKVSILPKIEEENEVLKSNLESITFEYEKYQEDAKIKIDEIKESMRQKFDEQQQATIHDASSQIDRIRCEYKAQMKQRSLEMKEKLKKANKQYESQTQRADALKAHYESILQNLRDKLNSSREAEMQAKDISSAAEIEVKQLKSKISSLMVDNKMLGLRLSSFEDKNKHDNSFSESQAKIQKMAADSKFEEKINQMERRDSEFIIRIADYLKQCFPSYNEIDSFEKIEYCIQNVVSQISELNLKMQKLTELQSEISKIRSFLSPDPNTSTYSAIFDKVSQLNAQINEMKKDNSEVWRNWAAQIVGTNENDELLMNDIEMIIKQNQINPQSPKQENNSTNDPYVKSLIGAMEAMGKKGAYVKKVYPFSSQA